MGGAKTLMMEEEERGYYRVDKHICADCLAESFLKKYVQDNADSAECSFCGKESEENIAIEFDDVMELVVAGIAFDWNDPNNEGIAYESREGGYLAPLTETGHLLADYDVADGEVLEAMIDSIQNDAWVEREFYRGTEDKILMYGWLDFRRTVLRKTRYLFSEIKDDAYYGHEIDPASFLRALGEFVNSLGSNDPLIKTLTVDDMIFRVRIGAKHYNTVQNLATPSQEFAIYSNRMRPAGIPMFYGAFDGATAFEETYDPASTKGRHVSTGTFMPLRSLKLLDLCDLPEIPSVFDIDRQHLIAALRFFHGFAADIAKPVKRDGREHIEYVPTQIVTEFFRHVYTTGTGEKLDGIIYRSSKNGGKPTCVLFCENDQACGAGRPTTVRDAILRLINVDHRIAS